jgi:hypothetical protein
MSGGRLIPEFGESEPADAPPVSERPPAPERTPPPEPPEPPSHPVPWDQPPPVEGAPPEALADGDGSQEPPHEPPGEPAPFAARFQLILGALLGIAAVAVVAALLIGTGPEARPDRNWSNWKPDTSKRGEAAQEIANHVAPSYRLDSGTQLVAVTGGTPQVADLPVRLALADQGNVSVLNGDGVLYTLCGLGPKCSIASGKPSAARHLILRREALELALYTFRYARGTDYVVALLPPLKGSDPTQAMFFRKDDLSSALDRPLQSTLPAPPPRVSTLDAGQVSTVQALTGKRLFQFKFEQGQDATVFMVLRPFPTG